MSGAGRKTGVRAMKFMLITNVARNAYDEFTRWSKQDFEAHNAFMRTVVRKLRSAGELISTEALSAPTQAKLVSAGSDSKPITRAAFPESKEYLAGYWIVEVDSPARAYQIAAELATAPGPGGAPGQSSIEVREILSGPPQLDRP
jgi:hypothetical protein